jgi:hypothetical protein
MSGVRALKMRESDLRSSYEDGDWIREVGKDLPDETVQALCVAFQEIRKELIYLQEHIPSEEDMEKKNIKEQLSLGVHPESFPDWRITRRVTPSYNVDKIREDFDVPDEALETKLIKSRLPSDIRSKLHHYVDGEKITHSIRYKDVQ